MKVFEALILLMVLAVGWIANEFYNRNQIQPPVALTLSAEVTAYIDKKFAEECNIDKAQVSAYESKIAALEKFKADRESLDNKREVFERAVSEQQMDRETLLSEVRKQEFLKFRNEVTAMCATPPPFKVKDIPKQNSTPTPSPTGK